MAMELEDNYGKKSSLLELMLNKATSRKNQSNSDIQALIENRASIQSSPSVKNLSKLIESNTPDPSETKQPPSTKETSPSQENNNNQTTQSANGTIRVEKTPPIPDSEGILSEGVKGSKPS